MANIGINGLNIDGFKETFKNLKLTEEEILKAAIKGMRTTALNIAGEAAKIVPRESGTLARSIVVTMGGTPTNSDEIYQNAKHNSDVINKAEAEHREVDPSELKRLVGKAMNKDLLIVSVSANTPYALKQHEDTTLQHKDGQQAKYLEIPFNAKKGELQENIYHELRKVYNKKFS